MGVEVVAIPQRGSSSGFVACYIPEGNVKPHRAEVGENYYIRMGDNFGVPPVALLRNLFYPRGTPFLVPKLTVMRDRITPPPQYRLSPFFLMLEIRNKGLRTAKDASFAIHIDPATPSFIPVAFDGARRGPSAGRTFGFLLNKNIHPDLAESQFGLNCTDLRTIADPMTITVTTCCEDTKVGVWRSTVEHPLDLRDADEIQLAEIS